MRPSTSCGEVAKKRAIDQDEKNGDSDRDRHRSVPRARDPDPLAEMYDPVSDDEGE